MRPVGDTGTGSHVWRPYIDPPLITPEMVQGTDVNAHVGNHQLRSYLNKLVSIRVAPVHTAVAFNAVYFGFDTETGGYAGGPLDIGDFPSVALGDHSEALPVGAMINVRTGGDLLPAEVVYKEGAHADLGNEGDTPGWLSGAPSAACGPGELLEGGASFLRERLVFDDLAFGQSLGATKERLNRLRRRGTIDEYGHLVVESQYAPSEGDLGDTEYYARYLMGRGRNQLTSSLAPTPLPLLLRPGAGWEETEVALLALMRTVRVVLGSLPTVRMWGEYAFTSTSMADSLGDRGPVRRSDLDRLVRAVVRSAVPSERRRPGRRRQAVYTALGPALRALSRESRDLRTAAYPLAVCHANTLLMDHVLGEADEGTGLLPNGVRLVVDDLWQGGGVWRAQYSAGEEPLLVTTERCDEPLGRGWLESGLSGRPAEGHPAVGLDAPDPFGDVGTGAELVADDGILWPNDGGLDGPLWKSSTDDRIEWVQPLRLWHLTGGTLPLPDDVQCGLVLTGAPHEPVRFLLGHEGRVLPAALARRDAQLGQGQLSALAWPTDFFPGILLSLVWLRGSRTVHARTRLLPRPETIDEFLAEHRYERRVFTRDGAPGGSEWPGRAIGGSTDWLVMVAVRRLGLLDIYGRALLPRSRLKQAIRLVMTDVSVHPDLATVEAVLDDLLTDGRLTVERGSRGDDDRPHYPPRPGESVWELVCYTPLVVCTGAPESTGPETGSGHVIKEHHVPGFLRYIGHLGYEASAEQRRLFRQDFLTFGLAGTPEIPPGYTYVRPHRRGY
ncbi:hypothetical protein ABZY02_32370 [Streptomyces sp. NPDC006649]|uniref:hypothetical protein n=1 Tax=Streptomyces sp. NPDC006649 TaxID=3156896 RepID=UPI0033B9D21E